MEEEKNEIRDKSLKEKVDEIYYSEDRKKQKKFKIPFKGRVGKSKLKNGYITVVSIEENRNLDFIREPIIDGTIKLQDTFHAIDETDVFFYKNKPIVFQAKKKLNPFNPLEGLNETYGQKYVMARMEGDKIITKKSMGMGMSIGLLIIGAVIAYGIFFG